MLRIDSSSSVFDELGIAFWFKFWLILKSNGDVSLQRVFVSLVQSLFHGSIWLLGIEIERK